jgi:hypothetical protein
MLLLLLLQSGSGGCSSGSSSSSWGVGQQGIRQQDRQRVGSCLA